MNITDSSYYQRGKKFIPSVTVVQAPVDGVPNVNDKLQYFIDKYERLLLIDLFGATLYNEITTALQDLPNADIKWQNLISGCTYTVDGKEYVFDGLRGYLQDSLVAYFVYCKYMENDESYYSTSGTVKLKSDNSEPYNPTRKYIDCWNEFLSKYQNDLSLEQPMYYTLDGDIVGVSYYNERVSSVVTLEQFLKDNETDYEGYEFKRYEQINSFGI